MLHVSFEVPERRWAQPAPGFPDPASQPQIQPRYLIHLQGAIAGAIQAPPPTPVSHSP